MTGAEWNVIEAARADLVRAREKLRQVQSALDFQLNELDAMEDWRRPTTEVNALDRARNHVCEALQALSEVPIDAE